MKWIFAVLLVAVVAFGQENEIKPGRYQLFVADVNSYSGVRVATMFRLDTITGTVWRFDENVFKVGTNQVFVTGWTKIPEDFDAEYIRLMPVALPVNLTRTNASPRVSKYLNP